MAHNLILTGFSGAGKSEVGRLIARAAGRDFIDTDEEWSWQVVANLVHAPHSPSLGYRIWP